jgi:hypothetical protein
MKAVLLSRVKSGWANCLRPDELGPLWPTTLDTFWLEGAPDAHPNRKQGSASRSAAP